MSTLLLRGRHKNRPKFDPSEYWSLTLHCTRSAAAYKIYRTPNDRAQPELWTEIVNACPIIDRLTRPILPSGVPNGEDGKLCAADGWIDEGREHVTGTLSKDSG